MGNCNSCDSTNVETAKVILHDGRFQEFAYPVRVSQVLEKNPRCFVCNIDGLDFDTFISAMNGDQELQPGRLYFALPKSWLKTPLTGEKMVSLAAKASLALKMMSSGGRSTGCGCGPKADNFMVDIISNVLNSSSPKTVAGGGTVGGRDGGSMINRKVHGSRAGGGGLTVNRKVHGGGGGGSGGRGRHTKKLSVILEEQGGELSD